MIFKFNFLWLVEKPYFDFSFRSNNLPKEILSEEELLFRDVYYGILFLKC